MNMALTAEQEKELLDVKEKQKQAEHDRARVWFAEESKAKETMKMLDHERAKELMALEHAQKMARLDKMLEIAKLGGMRAEGI